MPVFILYPEIVAMVIDGCVVFEYRCFISACLERIDQWSGSVGPCYESAGCNMSIAHCGIASGNIVGVRLRQRPWISSVKHCGVVSGNVIGTLLCQCLS